MNALKALNLAGRLYDLTDEQLEGNMTNEEVELVSTILMTATNKNMEPESLIRVAVEAVAQYTNYKLKSKI
ncbi:hypothetical protein ACRXID_01920 [Ligilactobacillus animalis]|uniref:Uncharacterized protein n=1 Tax=Ligilactobacillus animalis TaxID=1605 RepID=A0ABR4RQT2_9LACO|nr:hypothetical protein [Ligilactobacillus animalis]KDA46155.1 hypothetical protein Lani381_0839 [Ligilactobacillus animalis]MEE0261055.1 hypothetical protein [Ligilactobacillus animalis]PNQ52962.1 hypothetical protein C0L91_02175 [Ligilactobacillus animalis]